MGGSILATMARRLNALAMPILPTGATTLTGAQARVGPKLISQNVVVTGGALDSTMRKSAAITSASAHKCCSTPARILNLVYVSI